MNTVGQVCNHLHVVLDPDDGHLQFLLDTQNKAREVFTFLAVKSGGRHFLLQYDTARAGDFAPLRFIPKDRGVVLGLVSSKTPVLESLDVLKRRTEEATRYIDLDRLAISPQCGFASTVAGNPLTEVDERAKLARVVEAADAIWR